MRNKRDSILPCGGKLYDADGNIFDVTNLLKIFQSSIDRISNTIVNISGDCHLTNLGELFVSNRLIDSFGCCKARRI